MRREAKMENFARVVPVLEKAVSGLVVKSAEQIKKLERLYKRDYATIGIAFHSLGSAMDFDSCSALGTLCLFCRDEIEREVVERNARAKGITA
jgi:hypothetical protein